MKWTVASSQGTNSPSFQMCDDGSMGGEATRIHVVRKPDWVPFAL